MIAVFVRKWHLPVLVAMVLAMGAAGAAVATFTGGQNAEMAGELAVKGEQVLDEHGEWGERARNAGVIAATLAIISVALVRHPAAGRLLGAFAALAAIAAALSVAQAGHYGGQVVYKYGVGVNASAGTANVTTEALKQGGDIRKSEGKKKTDDD